jgi:SagB-type dehydrogenase family enzyme
MAPQLGHVWPMQAVDEQNHILLLLSELYHENSKLTPADWELARQTRDDPVQRLHARHAERQLQESYDLIQYGAKQYLNAPRIALPAAPQRLQSDLADVLRRRRSVRAFSGAAITMAHLAALLDLSYGITRYEVPQTQAYPRRAVPSGGGLYPLEIYALALHVTGLAPGVYHYEVYSHALEQLASGDVHQELRRSLLYEELCTGPAVVLVMSGLFSRPRFKYGELGYRLLLKETGHVGQNIALTATALGLGACPVEGFVEDRLNDLLGLDGVDERALYLFVIGQEQGPAAPL